MSGGRVNVEALTPRRVIIGLSLLTCLVGATLAFFIVSMSSEAGVPREELRKLNELDAKLDVEMLRAVSGLAQNYDDVADAELALRAQCRKVFEIGEESGAGDAKNALAAKLAALDALKENAAIGRNARAALLKHAPPDLDAALLRYAWRMRESVALPQAEEPALSAYLERLGSTEASLEKALASYFGSGMRESLEALIQQSEQKRNEQLQVTAIAGVALGLMTFALLAAITWVIRMLFRARAAAERTRAAAERFVPPGLLRALGKNSVDEVDRGTSLRCQRTVMFVDIRDFTSHSKRKELTALFEFMNTYLATVGGPIRDNSGIIVEYRGDGVLAVFETPRDAVAAARGIMRAVRAAFDKEIDVGIGMHTGEVMLGTFGDEHGRMNAGVVGETVSIAARIEGQTKEYRVPILASDTVRNALEGPERDAMWRVAIVDLIGVRRMDLFEVPQPEQLDVKKKYASKYDDAMSSYVGLHFENAMEQAREMLGGELKEDALLASFFARCQRFRANPPASTWAGVEKALTK